MANYTEGDATCTFNSYIKEFQGYLEATGDASVASPRGSVEISEVVVMLDASRRLSSNL